MANPNLLSNTTGNLDILIESRLALGDNDYVVPSSVSWTLRSLTICNVTTLAAILNLYVIKSGGGARKVLHNQTIAAGDTLVVGSDVIAALPAAATLRMNSSVASTLDVVATGMVLA